MKVKYTTKNGEKTVACDRYERGPGAGAYGPHVLTFYKGSGEKERVCGGASAVLEFKEVS